MSSRIPRIVDEFIEEYGCNTDIREFLLDELNLLNFDEEDTDEDIEFLLYTIADDYDFI